MADPTNTWITIAIIEAAPISDEVNTTTMVTKWILQEGRSNEEQDRAKGEDGPLKDCLGEDQATETSVNAYLGMKSMTVEDEALTIYVITLTTAIFHGTGTSMETKTSAKVNEELTTETDCDGPMSAVKAERWPSRRTGGNLSPDSKELEKIPSEGQARRIIAST